MKYLLSIIVLVFIMGCAHVSQPPAPPVPFTTNCPNSHPIKGNITDEGRKIFHTPRSPWYGRTNPEVCFSSLEDAFNAGFNPPKKW